MNSATVGRVFGFGLAVLCACGDSTTAGPQPSSGDAAVTRTDSSVPPQTVGGDKAPQSDAATSRPDAEAPRDAAIARDAQVARPDASATPAEAGPADTGAEPSREDAGEQPAAVSCKPRRVEAAEGVRFHHIHLNSVTPDDDLAFYEKFFAAPPVEFCTGEDASQITRATKTDRGWFLYTKVAQAPNPELNTYLEHIGWIHPNPASELTRLFTAGAPMFPVGRGQCETAFMGTAPCNNYWFYLQAPNGARVEVALGPGPATTGFGHVHFFMGTDYTWYETVTGGTFKNKAIDLVNHTDAALQESVITMLQVVDTRGKPIDHIGYSTTDLDAEKERLVAAGIEIAEDISWKAEYGFRSFFVRSAKGVWVELVEDSPFVPEAAP